MIYPRRKEQTTGWLHSIQRCPSETDSEKKHIRLFGDVRNSQFKIKMSVETSRLFFAAYHIGFTLTLAMGCSK
jgi:hypothetical protein